MRRAYKFVLRPTVRQAAALTACLGDHRHLYNAALQERRDAYRMRGHTVRYGDQSAQLKDIRRSDPDQGRWSFSSQQATLRRLGRAFDGFFRRVRNGQTPGFPRFKGAGWFDTVEWPKDGDGARWDSTPDNGQVRVYLQGVGHVRVHQHRKVKGVVKTISVKREGRRWYVILACDEVPSQPLPATGVVVGIDMGVASFLTTSDGEHIANPRTSPPPVIGLPQRSGRSPVASAARPAGERSASRPRRSTERYGASGWTLPTKPLAGSSPIMI